jgi:hypothetical protein
VLRLFGPTPVRVAWGVRLRVLLTVCCGSLWFVWLLAWRGGERELEIVVLHLRVSLRRSRRSIVSNAGGWARSIVSGASDANAR